MKITKEQFENAAENSATIVELSKELHLSQSICWRFLDLTGLSLGKRGTRKSFITKGKKYNADDIRSLFLSNKVAIDSAALRSHLIHTGIKEAKCEKCGNSEWLGYPIPLELHHINGDHHDNTENNLMILCPTCHRLVTNIKTPEDIKGKSLIALKKNCYHFSKILELILVLHHI